MAAHQDAFSGLTPPDPPLADGDLLLRPPLPQDIPWIVRGCQDPEVPRWTTVPSPYTEAHAREFVEESPVDWAQGTEARFAILLDGAGAGMIGIHRLLGDAAPEVGYWVGPWARRRGAASRATRLVVGWAFGQLGLPRLDLLTMPGNTGSEGVAAAAGFTRGPVEASGCDQRGTRVDVHRWTLSREDWARS